MSQADRQKDRQRDDMQWQYRALHYSALRCNNCKAYTAITNPHTYRPVCKILVHILPPVCDFINSAQFTPSPLGRSTSLHFNLATNLIL